MRRAAILLSLLAAGCFQLDVPSGLQCSDTPPFCPDGQSCVGGVCMAAAGDPDADPNAPDADPNAPDARPGGPDADTCSTQPELCNGLDDNCNGTTDEGFALGVACDGPDLDLCQEGVTVCAADQTSTTCDDATGDNAETCNGTDDNCDGTIDEGCSCTDGMVRACGTDVGACMEGSQTCAGGTWGGCMGGVGPSAESCNGGDEDCDGMSDEDFPIGTPCTVGVGICQRTGALICDVAMTGTQCNAVPGAPMMETCNLMDDDCDGMTDDGDPGGGGSCSTGLPGICGPGTYHCAAGTVACQQNTPPAGSESCNGMDDDCDGMTDEGFSGLGSACDGADGDACAEGITVCNTIGTGTMCNDTTGTNAELCNGLDDDCDGMVDEGYGVGGACDGSDGDLCLEGTTVCSGPTGTTCNDTTGTTAEVCNAIDDDCDGMTNEGTCAAGTICNASTSSCQCNTTTGCSGCCSGGTTCNSGTSLTACGISGNTCFACPVGKADNCTGGVCHCGTGPACSGSTQCCSPGCYSICP